MGKIFTSILHERLMFWCESYEILPDAQFGFTKKRSTIDALFVMSTISEWFKKQRVPLFTAFIDFAKAFDSVNHSHLWNKLHGLGVSTKMLYTQASSVVINNNDISFQFQYKRGVRQGCKLSPLLFSLFMADTESHMSQDKCKGIQVNNSVLHLLMFADDLVLFSDSSEGLKLSLSSLESYCRCWDMKTNPTKTKVLIFSNMRVLGHFNYAN